MVFNENKFYILDINYDTDKIAVISGFKTYNETNGIVTDIKAFVDFRLRNDEYFKNKIIFQGTKSELLNDEKLMEKFNNIEEKINQLKETNYLLIIGN